MCRSTTPEGADHQMQFPSPCCFGPLYSARQHWDGEGWDLAPGVDATSLWWWWDQKQISHQLCPIQSNWPIDNTLLPERKKNIYNML